MTANELVALRQRAERAAQKKGGVVAVDGKMLLQLLDSYISQGITPDDVDAVKREVLELAVKRVQGKRGNDYA